MENILATMRLSVTKGAPLLAQELIWKIFFSSRARGVSMQAHFPWMYDASEFYCVSALLPNNKVAGTAILKFSEKINDSRFGMIGLVCVDDEYRGMGVATLIVSELIAFSRSMSLDALVLWTRTPEVYLRHGFDIESQDIYISASTDYSAERQSSKKCMPWPSALDVQRGCGLPPYAERGSLWCVKNAYIIVVINRTAHTLLEWDGHPESVVELIQSGLPEHFHINARKDDPLLRILEDRGVSLDMSASAFTMILQLNPNASASVPWIKFLDRI